MNNAVLSLTDKDREALRSFTRNAPDDYCIVAYGGTGDRAWTLYALTANLPVHPDEMLLHDNGGWTCGSDEGVAALLAKATQIRADAIL